MSAGRGAALAQDPDAPHRWRCDRAVQGKCVARGYWYVLGDDLAGVREAALVTDTAGTPSDAVREAAEALTVYCHVCEADRREPCHAVTTGDPAPYPHPERAVAAALAARGGE